MGTYLDSEVKILRKKSIGPNSLKKWSADITDEQTILVPNHELLVLKIIRIEEQSNSSGRVSKIAVLNDNFVENMNKIFNGSMNSLYQKLNSNLNEQEIKQNQQKCIDGWKKLYNFIDNSKQGRVQQSLKSPNLQKVGENYSKIEQKFEFILSSTKHQLNSFLKFYTRQLADIPEFRGQLGQIINVIINLSMLHPDNKYVINTRQQSRLEQLIIRDFSEIELIHKRIGNNQEQFQISVSKMLHNFLIADPQIRVDLNCEIIVETNFMVYIEIKNYKDSGELDEALKLVQDFLSVQVVFPHMIVGELSQDKVVEAYRKGITANLIIDFFCKCCSQKRRKYVNERRAQSKKFDMSKQDGVQKKPLHFLKLFAKDYEISLVPENVIQQLQLWEKEKNVDYKTALSKLKAINFEGNLEEKQDNYSDDEQQPQQQV